MRTGTTSGSAIAPTMPHMDGELLLGTDDCKRRRANDLVGAPHGRDWLHRQSHRAHVALLQKRGTPGKASARTPRGSGRTVTAAGNRRWVHDMQFDGMLRRAHSCSPRTSKPQARPITP